MQVLVYNDLNSQKITGFAKFKKAITADNFTQADVKKVGDNLYRAKLSQAARLLFSVYQYKNKPYCLVLEYLPNHEYEKSRFLAGAVIQEGKIPPIQANEIIAKPVVYLNTQQSHFYYLDKILSFDQQQQLIYDTPAPVVIIGSAGSGKTALTLEKMKHAVGDVLYVSHSAYLVQNSRNLYYAGSYQNDDQEEVDFLSFREYLESIEVPKGREIKRKDFEIWYQRHKHKELPTHKLFEEFKGVLSGPSLESPWLSKQQYLELGIKQSLFALELRSSVYVLFEKYLQMLDQQQLFDDNIVSQQYLSKVIPRYDFVVIDEVQDLTNTQLMLILKSLHRADQFMLCGDANQIVHPNFFSWSKLKSLFFDQKTVANQTLCILQANYRNSPLVTEVANRILKLKHARFGSVDKESNHLVKSVGEQVGRLQLLADTSDVRQQLDTSTARSTKFAVIVMHSEQKAEAARVFNTPLIFSIQEAKGLEYDSIILFNFISNEQLIFKEISRDVTLSDLEVDELKYARAKSKTDKSLEAYKFYINALYVAITRAVANLYILEAEEKHPLLNLLDLQRFTGELSLDKQESSLEEWQKEAHKLEQQGKQQQADDIRKKILKEKPVPWHPLDATELDKLKETLENKHKKSQLLMMEYSLLHQGEQYINTLAEGDFKAAIKAMDAKGRNRAIKALYKNHFILYDLKQPQGVLREVDKYGIDHRTRFNLTPLMTATFINNLPLVETLIERGADKTQVANHGLNAWQMLLSRILLEPNEIKNIAEMYTLLAPEAISIQVDGRLEKLDDHSMFGFLLNVFISLWYVYLPNQFCKRHECITAANLCEMLRQLPDSVLPPMKKKQAYISRYLSSNEIGKEQGRNRKLFKRYKRGHYVLNPDLQIRQGGNWYNLLELLPLENCCYQIPVTVITSQNQRTKDILKKNLDYFKNWLSGYS